MSNKPLFTEKEQIIGHINVTSGSLLITDGIWNSKSIHYKDKQIIDLEEDNPLSIPVTTILQNNRRFILIDLDAASINTVDTDVMVEGSKNNDKEPT